jgi:hypothetical protein
MVFFDAGLGSRAAGGTSGAGAQPRVATPLSVESSATASRTACLRGVAGVRAKLSVIASSEAYNSDVLRPPSGPLRSHNPTEWPPFFPPVNQREVARCGFCSLVQFRLDSNNCRRCHLDLDAEPEQPQLPAGDACAAAVSGRGPVVAREQGQVAAHGARLLCYRIF